MAVGGTVVVSLQVDRYPLLIETDIPPDTPKWDFTALARLGPIQFPL